MRELRISVRSLAARPALSGLIIAIVALGIAMTTTVFSVVDQTLLRSAPFLHGDRLVDVLDTHRTGGGGGSSLTPQKILGWQSQPLVFERFEGYSPRRFDLTGGKEPERIQGLAVSVHLFDMLGVQPHLGRGFVDGDGRPGSERAVIISERLVRRRFGRTADVLGGRLALNDEEYVVIGVMPAAFSLLNQELAWIPLDLEADRDDPSTARFHGLGRLPPGLLVADAQTRADSIADHLQEQTPLRRTWGLRLTEKRVASVEATTRVALLALLGAVGFFLLLTCANAANLFLVHAAARQREIGIRAALGASRSQLVRGVFTESILLALAGGTLGVVLARWGVHAIVSAAPANLTFRATVPIGVDLRVLAVAATATLLTGILFGIVPALRGSRPDLESALRGTVAARSARSFGGLASGLVVAEVALSLVLAAGAALMIRTLANLEAIAPGFNPSGLVAMHVDLPSDRYPTVASRVAFFTQVSEQLRGTPGIASVAVAGGVPPIPGGFALDLIEAEGVPPRSDAVTMVFNEVSPDYFRTLQIPLVAGRTFKDDDSSALRQAQGVPSLSRDDALIVNRMLAERFWPEGKAVGRRLRLGVGEPWHPVIGVVGDVESRIGDERIGPQIYHPWVEGAAGAARAPTGTSQRRGYDYRVLVVRADDPIATVPSVKAAVWRVDPSQPVERIALVADMYGETFDRQRFVRLLLTVFAVLGAVLTAAGVFAVVSQVVAQRTREVGIRMAVGAGPSAILRLIMIPGIRLTVIGIVAGVASAAALARSLSALLYEVAPHDPLSFAAGAAGVLLVALTVRHTMRYFRARPAHVAT